MKRHFLLLFPLLLLFVPHAGAQTAGITLPECSPAVHDSYRVQGPDGAWYPTWHPQVDYVNGCYFAHEHGSDPESFKAGRAWADDPAMRAAWPAFGYTASRMGMPEGHAGFKVYVLQFGGYAYQITQHFGTGAPDVAACARYHTIDLAVRAIGGPLVADLHLMGDFGKAESNVTHTALTPPACPSQGDLHWTISDGVRDIPVLTDDPSGLTGYEPWRVDSKWLFGGNLNLGAIQFNTYNPQKLCSDTTCTQVLQRWDASTGPNLPANGTVRFVTVHNVGTSQGITALRIRASGVYSGTFSTDGHGLAAVDANAPGAVRQYVQPGLDLTLPSHQWWQNGQNSIYEIKQLAQQADWEYRRNPFVTGAN